MFNTDALSYLRKLYADSDGMNNIVVPRELIGVLLDPRNTIVTQDLLDACDRIENRYAQYNRLGMSPSDIERVITAIRNWILMESVYTNNHAKKLEPSQDILYQIQNKLDEIYNSVVRTHDNHKIKLLCDAINILLHPAPNGEFCNKKCPLFKHVHPYDVCSLNRSVLKSRHDGLLLTSNKCKEFQTIYAVLDKEI